MPSAWAFMERVDAPDYDEPDENYMTRWRLISAPWFGVYVHRLDKPDPRPTLHDHPWPFLSLILRGGYTEDFARPEGRTTGPVIRRERRSWKGRSIHRMRKADAHTITKLHRSPTWTLVLVGRRKPKEPSWGYWDHEGWVPFDQHPHAADFAKAEAARRQARHGAANRRRQQASPAPLVTQVRRAVAARRRRRPDEGYR